MRAVLLATASAVQYEAAGESGRQMGIDLRPEPFAARQQRQRRMDGRGGKDEDGTLRELVDLAPPVEQPHVERERCHTAAAGRMPRSGAVAYRFLPLTGAFQSSFPLYRQRLSFGMLRAASQLSDIGEAAQLARCIGRLLADLFRVDEHGAIQDVLKTEDTPTSAADIDADAVQ